MEPRPITEPPSSRRSIWTLQSMRFLMAALIVTLPVDMDLVAEDGT